MTKKILIVDDEQTLIEVMKMCLETNGYEVVTANNGERGLMLWKQEKPDLILLDCIMPKMDGVTFILEAHRREDLPPVPIIMLSAKEDAFGSMETDKIVDRLSKPCGLDELMEKIEKYIK